MKELISIMIRIIVLLIIIYPVFYDANVAVAIFGSVFMTLDYFIWKAGDTDALFFGDTSQIEKDLREIQKLEIKLKLKKMQEENE